MSMSEQSAEKDALAQAWDEGFSAGVDYANSDFLAPEPANPYRATPPGGRTRPPSCGVVGGGECTCDAFTLHADDCPFSTSVLPSGVQS